MQSMNGAQFLNIIPLFLLSNYLFGPVAFYASPVIVIVTLASIY